MAGLFQQFALTALFLILSADAFTNQITRQGAALVPPSISYAPTSSLFGNKRSNRPKIFMTEEANEPEEPEIQTTNSSEGEEGDQVEEKRTRTLLLTVPLFCKFFVVLVLKIATDLIVYPLLFLYRLAGIVKRKVLSLIGRGGGKPEKMNGES